MFNFISTALAEVPAAAPAAPNPFGPFLMLGGMLLIFYFFLWRPQNKRAKEHKQLIESLSKGDEILLNGGLLGKIIKVEEQYLIVEIANQVEVKVQRNAITSTLPKGTLKAIGATSS